MKIEAEQVLCRFQLSNFIPHGMQPLYEWIVETARRQGLLGRLLTTNASGAVLLIRLIVGAVFLSEGIQKFLFPGQLGAGRFAKIGLPSPEILAPFVGSVEIVCGTLVLLGLATRLASLPLLAVMSVALATTKWPILMNQGFWVAAHEARTDWSMFLGALFLLIAGGGAWSLDAMLTSRARRRARHSAHTPAP